MVLNNEQMAYLYNGVIMKKRIDKRSARVMIKVKRIRKKLTLSVKKIIMKVQLFIRIGEVRVYSLYKINYPQIILLRLACFEATY